jgi:hypothetical protein
VNPDLAVAGFCTVFDEPSVDGRPAERREDYELFPDFFNELPLRVDHHLIVTSSGAYNAGKVSRFAIVDGAPPIPTGVLCLAQRTDSPIQNRCATTSNRSDSGPIHRFTATSSGIGNRSAEDKANGTDRSEVANT